MYQTSAFNLPDDFVSILKVNTSRVSDHSHFIAKQILEKRPLAKLVQEYFIEPPMLPNISTVVQAKGWDAVKTKLAALYLYRKENGQFPTYTDVSEIPRLKKFEEMMRSHSLEGISRVFLLGLYFEMLSLDNLDWDYVESVREVLPLLKCARSRVMHTDYLVLFLLHLHETLGMEESLKYFSQDDFDFEKIWQYLDAEKRQSIVEKLLHYALAINEPDFFIKLEV